MSSPPSSAAGGPCGRLAVLSKPQSVPSLTAEGSRPGRPLVLRSWLPGLPTELLACWREGGSLSAGRRVLREVLWSLDPASAPGQCAGLPLPPACRPCGPATLVTCSFWLSFHLERPEKAARDPLSTERREAAASASMAARGPFYLVECQARHLLNRYCSNLSDPHHSRVGRWFICISDEEAGGCSETGWRGAEPRKAAGPLAPEPGLRATLVECGPSRLSGATGAMFCARKRESRTCYLAGVEKRALKHFKFYFVLNPFYMCSLYNNFKVSAPSASGGNP